MVNNFVVLDIETTGLSKHKHQITEIAALKIKNGKIIDKFETLINPKVPIPRFITNLTGINNELVKNSPSIDKILPDFLRFVNNLPIVAHNASFDHGFISYNVLKYLNKEFNNQKICTKLLANRLLPNLKSKKLSSLCEYFNLNNENAHRAMSDVKVTYQLFSEFINLLDQKGISSEKDLLKYQKSKIQRN